MMASSSVQQELAESSARRYDRARRTGHVRKGGPVAIEDVPALRLCVHQTSAQR
jgi:hypothetical protein